MLIDSRSQEVEVGIKSLTSGRKKRGSHRAYVLQFSVTLSASSKDIGTSWLCMYS